MHLIRGLHNLKNDSFSGSVVTIGNYDGVHLGHQKIISLLKKKSRELGLSSVVVIFEPQPEEFFTGDKSQRLTSMREKLVLLGRQGVDKVLLLPFNAHMAAIKAEDFVNKILVAALKVRYLVVGDDFVFGHGRHGNFRLLESLAMAGNFQVIQLPSFKSSGMRVSSSLIRCALAVGDFALAAKFLGRAYALSGRVIHGAQLGRSIGFPTANIYLRSRELPFIGVYLVKVHNLGPTPLFGLVNIGLRPTVSGKQKSFEVFILDFSADIYQKRITIEFIRKIREEIKFNSMAELQAQISQDLVIAKGLI